MIKQEPYAAEPWALRETSLRLEYLAQAESVFALSNGHLGLRGNLDEGEPVGLPGTYLAGFYETRPLPYAEAGYGYPEAGQTVINVTNGKLVRLLVNDELLDVEYGRLHTHERTLDLRRGVLERRLDWESPAGTRARVSSTRLVSFTHRAIAAIRYEVEVERPSRIAVQSELVANEDSDVGSDDPRAAAALAAPLVSQMSIAQGTRAMLSHSTRGSGLLMTAAMDHVIEGPENLTTSIEALDDVARLTLTVDLEPGQRLSIIKFLAYSWSSRRGLASVRAQAIGALAEAAHTGWDNLLAEQGAYLDAFWDRADVEVDGDPERQLAVRFALFGMLQAAARGEGRAIAAKGLTGTGYDGHAFWDTESFVLPVLTYTAPAAVRDALSWRHSILPIARRRAEQLGLRGATFPWRTIAGEECSAYWPAGTAAFHINADIADAVVRYLRVTGDERFQRDEGLELLVETARMFQSLGHHDPDGGFHIDGVTGPDEYSALVDDNVYTNLMAQQNLRAAAEAAERAPAKARRLGVTGEEIATWRLAADGMTVCYDKRLDVHPQDADFTRHAVWDFEATGDRYPLLLHFPYFDLYRKQVVKQADLVLALVTRGDAFTPEEKVRDFLYYEAITVRDSSLSACTQAVMAAETGHLELAYDYFCEAAEMDLEDLEHNTRDGLHIASLAGAWIATVQGFGGMRDHGGELSFSPRLPRALSRISFGLGYRGRRLRVEVTQDHARYGLREGAPLEVTHHGQVITVTAEEPVSMEIPVIVAGDPPAQALGRAPKSLRAS
ncbi:MAG TPA: glycosyl hydrolase family 65 protein [Solirubrobacteraceae bacterium]|nr:glycosyl hydrolase family 65 protein [Solirubrobacteraceae bacterium]